VYFSQRVAYNAQVASEFRHQSHDLVRIAQNFHALRVRVVTHPKRFLNAVGKFSGMKTDAQR